MYEVIYHRVFFFFYKFIYLFLAVLGLCCYTRAFSSCSERGLHFVEVHGASGGYTSLRCTGFLIVVTSLVVEHGL